MRVICLISILINLWFQFGADLFERSQFNKCKLVDPNAFSGVSFTPLLMLPGDFVFLNIMIAETCLPTTQKELSR